MPKTDDVIYGFISECENRYGVKCGISANLREMYHPELRLACEVNSCGNYGKCHTCPPCVGTAEDCIEAALKYSRVIVFRRVYNLEDSLDYYGMCEAKNEFRYVQQGMAELARKTFEQSFTLGAGGCTLCEKCTANENKPCRFPDRALSSLEAYCIQVSQLAESAGMKYINGQNTVTYFGGIFLD